MHRPVFFIRRGDRLGARIKAMLYGWRFARQVGGQAIMCWFSRDRSVMNALPAERYSPAHLWDLPRFYADRGFEEFMFLEAEWRGPTSYSALTSEPYAASRPYKFEHADFQGRDLTFVEDHMMTYRFRTEQASEIDGQIRDLYRRLPLSPGVSSILERASSALGVEKYTVLHVRRGDITGVLNASLEEMQRGEITHLTRMYLGHLVARTAPYSFYFPAVERALANGEQIVFFSDVPDAVKVFQKRFGKTAIRDATRFAERARFDVQRAFIDFNLIVRAQAVISTSSVFSKMASLLGGNELRSVAATGGFEEFEDYLFSDVLGGADLAPEHRTSLLDIIRPIYTDRAARSGRYEEADVAP